MKTLLLLCLLLSSPLFAQTGQFKFRAREHFEIHNIKYMDQEETYRGLTNTINAWYEVPFDYSFGLAFGPILGSASNEDAPIPELGEKIKLIHIGLEYKHFVWQQFFGRIGLGWTQIRSDQALSHLNGHHRYLGVGYEFKVGKFGIALEGAYRWSILPQDLTVNSISPSIGFHFYKI